MAKAVKAFLMHAPQQATKDRVRVAEYRLGSFLASPERQILPHRGTLKALLLTNLEGLCVRNRYVQRRILERTLWHCRHIPNRRSRPILRTVDLASCKCKLRASKNR